MHRYISNPNSPVPTYKEKKLSISDSALDAIKERIKAIDILKYDNFEAKEATKNYALTIETDDIIHTVSCIGKCTDNIDRIIEMIYEVSQWEELK